ncbi:MAG: hypothetical protein CVU39_23195 [Chloroflexi bacterium HGW-Chloroflexi-10]|nr:MAG: hypothetical protein CVU39_23195 [Chloroflexi bacterium HGW-Chloroflexi-10]
MKKHSIVAILFLVGTLILSACSLGANPTPTETIPQVDNTAVFETLKTQAMETAQAQLTQDALMNPTNTPIVVEEQPTATLEQPTATVAVVQPTAAPVLPTAAPVLPTATTVLATAVPTTAPTRSDLNCSVTASAPTAGQNISLGGDFDGRWTFKNTGSVTWETSEIDFVYLSGTKFQVHVDGVDLPKQVKNGESVEIIVDMVAPNTAGAYQAYWALKQGSVTFCTVSVMINAK